MTQLAKIPTRELDLPEIQGVIVSGYGHLPYAAYHFLQVEKASAARAWLREISAEVTTGAPWSRRKDGKKIKPTEGLNVAFTFDGLKALGVDKKALESFPVVFQEGMTHPVRAELNGDTGDSAPEKWEVGGPNTERVDILLMLFASTDEGLDIYQERHRELYRGVKEVFVHEGYSPADLKEHFGFQDAIAGVQIEGTMGVPIGTPDCIKAGEFILGHVNEYGYLSPVPQPTELGQNGSFLVYRKLYEDVGAFQKFLEEKGDGDQKKMDYIAAKMVGRWYSGAPLTLAPDEDDPKLGLDPKRNNNFWFMDNDAHGNRCPVASHIRRSNPRDSLGSNRENSIKTSNRHRIARRGRLYGSKYTLETANEDRGLLFICVNVDIARQFEFIQQVWINDKHFEGLYDDKDPICGDNDGTGNFTISRRPFRQQVEGIPRFVQVRGGGYFFVPGVSALRYIGRETF